MPGYRLGTHHQYSERTASSSRLCLRHAHSAAKHGVPGPYPLTGETATSSTPTLYARVTQTPIICRQLGSTDNGKDGRSEAEALSTFTATPGHHKPEVAATVQWLCNEEARSITGQAIYCGGEVMLTNRITGSGPHSILHSVSRCRIECRFQKPQIEHNKEQYTCKKTQLAGIAKAVNITYSARRHNSNHYAKPPRPQNSDLRITPNYGSVQNLSYAEDVHAGNSAVPAANFCSGGDA
jgi:hypothetical protein